MYRLLLAMMMTLALSVEAWAQDAEGVYSKVDENPSPIKTVRPEYPRDLKKDGISGLAAISCVIDEEGKVIGAKVVKSTHPGFERAALEAIERWRFKPGKVAGTAVKVRVTIPFRFNVED